MLLTDTSRLFNAASLQKKDCSTHATGTARHFICWEEGKGYNEGRGGLTGPPTRDERCLFEKTMSFDQREWVNDIATGAIAGALTAAVGAMLVPQTSFLEAVAAGGILGLVPGIVVLPLKWLLNRRPGPPSSKNRKDSQS